jgi:hypothetical protein
MKNNKKIESQFEGYNIKQYKEELIGHVGIDSGLLAIADLCRATTEPEYQELVKAIDHNSETNKFHKEGLVVQTGFGDGWYKVYARKNEEGQIFEVRIDLDNPRLRHEYYEQIIRSGKALTNWQSVSLVKSLLRKGKTTKYIVNLFKNIPDYNAEVLRHQVEYIRNGVVVA